MLGIAVIIKYIWYNVPAGPEQEEKLKKKLSTLNKASRLAVHHARYQPPSTPENPV
jgi:hypothetical protein